jgi:myosin heavy subunit
MKKILILICMVGLGFLLAWVVSDDSSQQKAELESLNAELQQLKTDIGKTEIERDTLKVRIVLVEQNRDKLQEQVDELAGLRDRMQEQADKLTFSRDQSRQQLAEIIGSRDKLKQQLTELTTSRNQLQKQVDELTRSRDTAVADAQAAQKRIDKLVAMLDTETQKFSEPQDKLIVSNQAEEDTQTGTIEVSEDPDVLTEINWPSVVSSDVSEPPVVSNEVIEPPVISSQAGERPACHSFNTSRPQIMPGQTSTLSWQVSNADRVRIEPGIGPVSALGSMAVNPSTTTTYTLIATNKAGESILSCRIEVKKRITIFSTDRSRTDESGKFIFIPVYENNQEE